MDFFEQFEKFWVSTFFIEARELLTEFKEKIYPRDYNYLTYLIAKTENNEKYFEEWHQSIGERDTVHSLIYNINDGFLSDMAKANNILNSPPENADHLRSETSKSLMKKVDQIDQLFIEMKKFDISVKSGDGYIHIDWSRSIWIMLYKIVQAYLQSMYHFLMIQPKEMILIGKRAIELCVGEWQDTPFKIAMMSNLAVYYRVINDVENALEIRLQIEKHLELFIKQYGHIPKNVDGKPNYNFLGNYGVLGNIYA